MTDKYTNLFKLEKNKVEGMCINEDMTDEEKGEAISNFMAQFGLTQKQVADLLGLYSQRINRWYLTYKRITELDEETKKQVADLSDRNKLLVLRIKEPNKEKKTNFFMNVKKGLPTADLEKIVAILNGDMGLSEYEKHIKKQYEMRLKIVDKLKKELLHLS